MQGTVTRHLISTSVPVVEGLLDQGLISPLRKLRIAPIGGLGVGCTLVSLVSHFCSCLSFPHASSDHPFLHPALLGLSVG